MVKPTTIDKSSKTKGLPAKAVGRILGAKQLRDRYIEVGGAIAAKDPNTDPKDLLIPECVECPHCVLPVWPQQASIATQATFERFANGAKPGGKQGMSPKMAKQLLAASGMMVKKGDEPAKKAPEKPVQVNEFGDPDLDLDALFAEAADGAKNEKQNENVDDLQFQMEQANVEVSDVEESDDDGASSTDTIGEFERKIKKLENLNDKLEEKKPQTRRQV